MYLETNNLWSQSSESSDVTKLVNATVEDELLINAWVPERLLLLNDFVEVIPVFKLLPMELRELFLRMG